jgi:EAL domain-containing protein (putative c-di-GMP-specific phosphodiesterase class I)
VIAARAGARRLETAFLAGGISAFGLGDAIARMTEIRYDQIQGFYIQRPVPAAEFDHWMSQRPVPISGLAHGAGA